MDIAIVIDIDISIDIDIDIALTLTWNWKVDNYLIRSFYANYYVYCVHVYRHLKLTKLLRNSTDLVGEYSDTLCEALQKRLALLFLNKKR
jgi:hypothetical protein